jgi:hypothetical protein
MPKEDLLLKSPESPKFEATSTWQGETLPKGETQAQIG